MSQRKNVFISYSHQDKSWLDRLSVHLRPLEKKHRIVVWSDTRINPGLRWQDEVAVALASTKVAVLLVSADFLSSEFITNNELPSLLQASEEEGMTILPLIVSPCGFLRTEGLYQFQSVNDPAQPLIKLSRGDQEEVLEKLAGHIEKLLTQSPEKVAATPVTIEDQTATLLWTLLRGQLQLQLDPEEFTTWFHPLKVKLQDENQLVLVAPNARFCSSLRKSYQPVVDRVLAGLPGLSFQVIFGIDENAASSLSLGSVPSSPFNPKYLFETFVEGRSNEFALAAAMRVSESPSQSYNPLFLYGGVGLGKTHLLHAIGHVIQRTRPQFRILYLQAEQFINEFLNSLRFNSQTEFRERFRKIDLLMIDDVQFLANKELSQQAFYDVFNLLYTSNKQIVLACDCSPRNIPTLEDRIRSRFEWGLIADVQPPDEETKMAIIRRKADIEGVTLPPELAQVIANQVRSNIRELEGLVNRVLAFSSLTGKPLSLALVLDTLKNFMPENGNKPAAVDIIKYVSRHFDLKVSELKNKSNTKEVLVPRQIAMYLCRKLTGLSFPEIGRLFGNKHHSTVMYAVEKIQKMRAADSSLDQILISLERHFTC
ncbi:MAG TPA: chromosomal replication initiator protein DnaA [Thermoanaerobaculia bacterium]